jgi:filamentous hemagglutinin family protein
MKHAPFRLRLAALLTTYLVFFSSFPSWVWANPNGFDLKSGTVTTNTAGGTLTINQTTAKAIIHWTDFSIASGETTQFNLPNASGATLNRVTGALSSQIAGTLRSNGQLFLINQNGILVTGSGVINTAGFLGSTRDISDANFLAGGSFSLSGTSSGGVTVLPGGQITASSGDVILIGQTVSNSGTLSAPNGVVGLAAGKEIVYQPASSEVIRVVSGNGTVGGVGVQNTGVIQAAQAELKAAGGNVYGLAVNARGAITATGTATRDGRILLTSNFGNVAVSGTLKAREAGGGGGTITTRGTRTPGAIQSTPDKLIVGKGGTLEAANLTLAANNSVRTYATLNAGPAGFVNVNAKTVDYRGTTTAGTVNVRSQDSLQIKTLGAAPDEPLFDDPPTPSQIEVATLNGAGAKVVDVESTNGDLTVANQLFLPANTGGSLRLAAARSANVNANTLSYGNVEVQGATGVNIAAPLITYGSGASVFVKSNAGRVNLYALGRIEATGGLIAVAGATGFSNTSVVAGTALKPGAGGRWIIFSPSAAQTVLGGLSPVTTLFNTGQPANLAGISSGLGNGTNTLAFASADPSAPPPAASNASTTPPPTFSSATVTGGFVDEIPVTGSPSQPLPSLPGPSPADLLLIQNLYALQQSPTYHAGVLVPASETAAQRAARLAKEGVILQMMGLPNDPALFPFIFAAVQELLGPNATPDQIAAFFASLATNEEARYALGGLMSINLVDAIKSGTPSAVEQAVLDRLQPQMQQDAVTVAKNTLQGYEDYKVQQYSSFTSGNLAMLAIMPGQGYAPPSTLVLLNQGNAVALNEAERFGVALGAGLTGAGLFVGAAALTVIPQVVAVINATVTFGVAMGDSAAAIAAATGEAVSAGFGAAGSSAASAVAPAVFVVFAIFALTYGVIEANKIAQLEKAMKQAVADARTNFSYADYSKAEGGNDFLTNLFVNQFCIKPAGYAAGVQAAAMGIPNLPVTTH